MLGLGVMSVGTGMGWRRRAQLSVQVEEPEQKQTTAQKASYVALFWDMCTSGEGNARKPGGVERCAC